MFKSIITTLFTGGIFYLNLNNIHEYLIGHSLKSGGTKDHFNRLVKVAVPPLLKGPDIPLQLYCGGRFSEIPKHAGPTDKFGKNQFGPVKHWFPPDRTGIKY